jgi:ribulose-phosphate 3-epimerase
VGDLVDLVLLMTVEPGFGGQEFMRDQLPKIAAVRALRELRGFRFAMEVDGGLGPENAAACAEAGAEYLVAGTSVFGRPDRSESVAAILRAAASRA